MPRLRQNLGWAYYEIWVEVEPPPIVDEVEPNDTIDEANPLPVDEWRTGMLTNGIDEYDYWAFTLDTPSSLSATVHILSGSEEMSIAIGMQDKGVFASANTPENGYIEAGPEYVPPGDYYVRLYVIDLSYQPCF